MSSAAFSIVDVFSTTPFKGNPLAVVDDMTSELTTTQMQLLARQFNLSETTFFQPPTTSEAAYGLRSFLPDGREVFGAGHNILGVWWHLAHSGLLDLGTPAHTDEKTGAEVFVFHQELGGEVLPLKILRQKEPADGSAAAEISVVIRQARPQSHDIHPDPAALAASLGLAASDIGLATGDTTARPQVMSTSTTRHLIVPLASEEALRRAVVQRDRLLEQLALVDRKAYGLYLFTGAPSPSGGATYKARFFSPGMSAEDPATASAAGPLAVYLYRQGQVPLAGGRAEVTVRQGEMVGRECVIRVALTLGEDGLSLDSDIVGSGVGVAEGRIVLPDLSAAF